jgi:polar amino acid transport system substrate-binding protein
MMMHLSKTPERSKDYYFIGPMAHETLLLFTRKKHRAAINTLIEIKQAKLDIGAVRGIYYGAEFKVLNQQSDNFRSHIVLASSFDQMLNMFVRQSTDGFLYSSFYGRERQQALAKLAGIEVSTVVLRKQPIYFAFSRASIKPPQLTKLQKAFEQSLEHPLFKYALEY